MNRAGDFIEGIDFAISCMAKQNEKGKIVKET